MTSFMQLRSQPGERCHGRQVAKRPLHVGPPVESALLQLRVDTVDVRSEVVALPALTHVPHADGVHDPELAALAMELVPFQLEPPAHSPLCGERHDAIAPTRAHREERADLDERRPPRDRQAAGSGDAVVELLVGASRLREIEPRPRAQGHELVNVSPVEHDVVVGDDEPPVRAPRPAKDLVQEGEPRSAPRAHGHVREVVDDLVQRPPGDGPARARARARRRREHNGHSVLDRRRRARPEVRTTASPKATSRPARRPTSRAGGRSDRTGSRRWAPAAGSGRESSPSRLYSLTRRYGVRPYRRHRSSTKGAGGSRLHSGLSSTITAMGAPTARIRSTPRSASTS